MRTRWLAILVAALAMVATLPGRTQGLGLITEPLLTDFQLDRVVYASMNLWATLIGATFCVPWGWLLDRWDSRTVLTGTLLALASVVIAMSQLHGEDVALCLFALILLTRGLGQSALSVVSLTLMGKAGGCSGRVIGVYSFLVAIGYSRANAAVQHAAIDLNADWRLLWAGIGWTLAAIGVIVWFLPISAGPEPRAERKPRAERGYTLPEALKTPAFWIFALATSFYGMVVGGISLFNESILKDRGFDREVFLTIATYTPLVGLASNLVTGWLAERWPLPRLLAAAMALLMSALVMFPHVSNLTQVYAYATVMGIVGGMITTLFFAVWSRAYGPMHLGKIQGAAQMLTVLASAVGPLILATCERWTASYVLAFQYGSVLAGLLALAAWWSPMPAESSADVTDMMPALSASEV